MKLKLITVNAGGLESPGRLARFIADTKKWMRERGLHGVLVQEHNLDPGKHREHQRLAIARNMDLHVSYDTPGGLGVHWGGTLVLLDASSIASSKLTHSEAGCTIVQIEYLDVTFLIGSVYAPVKPQDRIDFFSKMRRIFKPHMILGGDWNCVPDVTVDVQTRNPLNYRNIGGELLNDIMSDIDLVDIRRTHLLDDKEPTRRGITSTREAIATRIDRWYVPTDEDHEHILWSGSVLEDLTWSDKKKDHSAVLLEIEFAEGEFGHERFTIKEDLLFEDGVQNKVIQLIKESETKHALKPVHEQWDLLMESIGKYLRQETKKRRRTASKIIEGIKAEIEVVKRLDKRYGVKPERVEVLQQLKVDLYEAEHPETKDVLPAKQAKQIYDLSDRGTKAFFRNYKAASKQQWINKVKIGDEWKEDREPLFTDENLDPNLTRTPKAVTNEFQRYYEYLFAAKKIDKRKEAILHKKLSDKKIFEASAKELDAVISEDEVRDVVENLPYGKSAGPDRIPNSVFRVLSNIFTPILTTLFNTCITRGELPKSFLEGDISVLYKKKDRDEVRNYRPITLLNGGYKIYTRVLAKRMKTVVHQFVSETQKGFVPSTFIGDCSMLMNLVEAYLNEDQEERGGLFVFLDMEKAFDRVSYSFLNKGLSSLGFGTRFCRAINMMYNEASPPKRRMYVNGYYSDSFDIKSGVAQGCPLSPLLFLIVAEALKISVEMQKDVKGIRVGRKYFKISQFADDTVLMLGKPSEIEPALAGIKFWCDATGMRENMTKREGLAMGKWRHRNLRHGIKWVKEGDWVISLGVPIGNDLDHAKWWEKKVDAINDKAKRWVGLYKSSRAGRNMIVQSMYYGSFRYWLYSTYINKATINRIATCAARLIWSREPDLTSDSRYRRWVRAKSAIGPRSLGGLNEMDWKSHVDAFMSEWILKYIQPGHASWKWVLDSMILNDKKGFEQFVEERSILFYNLSRRDKMRIMRGIPRKAVYIKRCIYAFWENKIELVKDEYHSLSGESPWRSLRFDIQIPKATQKYMSHTMEVTQLSDLFNKDRPFTRDEWKDWVYELHVDHIGQVPSDDFMEEQADHYEKVIDQIPADVLTELRLQGQVFHPAEGDLVGIESTLEPGTIKYGVYIVEHGAGKIKMIWLDTLGLPHFTGRKVTSNGKRMYAVETWKQKDGQMRIVGLKHAQFPSTKGWKIGKDAVNLDSLTIRVMTKKKAMRKFQPPPAQKAWEDRFGFTFEWKKVWGISPTFATPRDQQSMLKLQQRNLYVANRDSNLPDQRCHACLANPESMKHLGECSVIRRDFWDPLVDLLIRTGMTEPEDLTAFLILGRIRERKYIDNHRASLLFIAWRCLYAEIISCRFDNSRFDLERARKRSLVMLHSRATAYGEKWRLWVRRNWHTSNKHIVPERHRKKIFVDSDADGNYSISAELLRTIDAQ